MCDPKSKTHPPLVTSFQIASTFRMLFHLAEAKVFPVLFLNLLEIFNKNTHICQH